MGSSNSDGHHLWRNVCVWSLIMGMSMHDRYYEPEDDNDAEEFAERIWDMLHNDPEFDPSDMMNMGEAISQESTKEDTQQFIRDCVAAKDWAKLGLKLYTLSYEYQESIAEYRLM